MNLIELSNKIKAQEFHLIQVVELSDRNSGNLNFVGTLDEYLESVKILGVKVIYVCATSLTEEHFFDEETDDEDPLDLCMFASKLRAFKNKIGEDGMFELSVPIAHGDLRYMLINDWMETVADLISEAKASVMNQRMLKKLDIYAMKNAQHQSLLKKLQGLVNDKDFAQLPTQIAMRAFAIDKYPELEDFDEGELKRVIH